MQAVLGIGSNLGDRENNIALALDLLERLPDTAVQKLSSLYETEPFDVISRQDRYLNCCVLLETKLAPEELLDRCLAIEAKLGRVRKEYHGARTMDIDVLLCEGYTSCTEKLDRTPSPYPRAGLCHGAALRPVSAHNALGFLFHDAYEAVEKSGVKLYH